MDKKFKVRFYIIVAVVIVADLLIYAAIATWTNINVVKLAEITSYIEAIIGIYILTRLMSPKYASGGEPKKHIDPKIPLFFIVVFLLLIPLSLDKISVAEIITILVLFGTVLITAEYAEDTKRMANEMQEQRYDSARPVIDITDIEGLGRTLSIQIAEAKVRKSGAKITRELEWPNQLTCLLRNIGMGTATDIFSFITVETLNETGRKEHCEFRRLGPLERNTNLTDIASGKWHLFLMQRNGCKCLVTYYFDVYGRCFESIREVIRDETTGELKINPLKVKEIEDKEYKLLVKGNYTDFVDKLWPTSKQEAQQ